MYQTLTSFSPSLSNIYTPVEYIYIYIYICRRAQLGHFGVSVGVCRSAVCVCARACLCVRACVYVHACVCARVRVRACVSYNPMLEYPPTPRPRPRARSTARALALTEFGSFSNNHFNLASSINARFDASRASAACSAAASPLVCACAPTLCPVVAALRHDCCIRLAC